MKLSVIVPAYNEARQIKKAIARLASYLRKLPYSHEIIVVDDGSQDETYPILQNLVKQFQALRVIHNRVNHGKGYAVKCGVESAKGDFIFFTDADLSTPPREILKFVEIFESEKSDILIGSRHVRSSKIKIPQPCHRRLMGRVFNLFVKILTPLRFEDTQCGFKGFRKEAAQTVFPKIKESGFNFDVELLLIAHKSRLVVREIPITWVNYHQSKVSPLADSIRMFESLIRLSKAYKE